MRSVYSAHCLIKILLRTLALKNRLCTTHPYILPTGSLQLSYQTVWLHTLNTAIKICLGVCRAINYLHARQLAHRDIKPENIMLDDEHTPKLVDFEHSIQLASNKSTANNLPISAHLTSCHPN